jgi:hypothetical protein
LDNEIFLFSPCKPLKTLKTTKKILGDSKEILGDSKEKLAKSQEKFGLAGRASKGAGVSSQPGRRNGERPETRAPKI